MKLKIGYKNIGESHPVFIIAELSANQPQNYDLAVDQKSHERIRCRCCQTPYLIPNKIIIE